MYLSRMGHRANSWIQLAYGHMVGSQGSHCAKVCCVLTRTSKNIIMLRNLYARPLPNWRLQVPSTIESLSTSEDIQSSHENRCIVCGGRLSPTENKLFDTRFGIDLVFGAARCGHCGL